MIPHFEKQEAFPHPNDDTSEPKAANDATYRDTDPAVSWKEKIPQLSKPDLFAMRKAHEVNLKLGYREAKIDTDVIDEIKQRMMALDIDESEYQSFLTHKEPR